MWSLSIFCVVIVSVCAVSDDLKVFRKCCPRGQSLIKLTSPDMLTSEDSYKCKDSEFFANLKIPVLPLIIDQSVTVEYGIPENCDLEIVQLNGIDIEPTLNDVCYERLVLENINGTIKNIIPKTVALKCNDTEFTTNTTLHLLNIRKCCLNGQSYDTEYHICRNSVDQTNEEILKELASENGNIYEMDNGLHCKLEEYAVELRNNLFRFTLDGTNLNILRVDGKPSNKAAKGNWCVDQEYSTKRLMARVCTRDCKPFEAFCLRKCCPVGHHYRPFRCGSPASKCVPNTDENVLFNISKHMEPLRRDYSIGDVLGIRSEIFCKTGKVALNNSLYVDRHFLTPNGHLKWALGTYDDYCLEALDTRHCDEEVQTITVMCLVKPPHVKDFKVSFVLICISASCLALTLLVYMSLPELRNLHGLNLICHVTTMLIAYACLARVQAKMVADNNACAALGYGIYFGFVAAFAWLNVMCFDIWWTFGSVRTVQPLHKRSAERRRFMWYSLYAWGVSFGFILVTYLLDRFPVTPYLDANMGYGMCWFGSIQNTKSDWPHYIFFVIPMGLVTGINFILWLLTARHCARVKSEVHRLQAGSVGDRVKRRFRVDKANLALTGKLWVVMGAGWISELLSTVLDDPDGQVPWYLTFIDMVNELQGVFIFIILVFKRKIYYLVRKKMGLENGGAQQNRATSSGRTSSTFLSRTISTDERTNKRVSVPNDNAKIK